MQISWNEEIDMFVTDQQVGKMFLKSLAHSGWEKWPNGPQWVNGQQNHDENMYEFVKSIQVQIEKKGKK